MRIEQLANIMPKDAEIIRSEFELLAGKIKSEKIYQKTQN